MHGGVKVYHGGASGARVYLEADCGIADDYYLTEGTGLAQLYTVDAEGHVHELEALDGEGYEAWVAGIDPGTGEPKGRLRTDGRAVRFVELTVNGPKSWSLAAELHPDIAAAYEAAQDRAAAQVIGWLGQHATARVGPRGQQVAVPVERLEAVTVRHYTSRAGDPHRHLHLQVNARIWAAGAWRGLDTVALRDSIGAVNGIGHAAVATDPAFRAALAAHGYSLTASGEIAQLAPYVGAFSKRAAQIERNINRYEKAWRAEHPGQEPGRALRRSWDARAWADARPDKVVPVSGRELHERWLAELAELGYRDVGQPMLLLAPAIGGIDRDHAVQNVVARLGAARSAWNAADLRGEVEQLLARAGVVADPAARLELAEDLTARALARCVPLLDRPGVPEHVRVFTSRGVLAVEDELVGRLAVRGAEPGHNLAAAAVTASGPLAGIGLDEGQAAAVAALAGDRVLVVVEGAAGAGKTTLLAAAREHLDASGRRLVVVTPTLKAAQAASTELGARASSAAKLAYAHGWRWDTNGVWTRLAVGDLDPKTGRVHGGPGEAFRLAAGDLLLCDEAGMLDQDTARALLTVADEHGARVAFVGDRHQLAAVGRGGVLDHAARWADPAALVTVDVVHRFVHTTTDEHGQKRTVADSEYAQLTSAMRTGKDPDQVFDTLNKRGQIQLHADVADVHEAIARDAVTSRRAGRQAAVVAATREQVAELNTMIREAMIRSRLVNDGNAVTTRAGERIGPGDVIATRRNDRTLDVANRDTWVVTATTGDGGLQVTGVNGARQLPRTYVTTNVELAYATTVHGAQGSTTHTAHVVVDDRSTAAGAYVGMTRGRHANTAHLIATSVDDAREQWATAFGRDRADLGPAAARQVAERDAARYALAPPEPRPATLPPAQDAARLPELLEQLPAAWTEQINAHLLLDTVQWHLDGARAQAAARAEVAATLAPLDARRDAARAAAETTAEKAVAARTVLAERAGQISRELRQAWDRDRPIAADAVRTVDAGPGRLHQRARQVRTAQQQLDQWADTWRPVLDLAAQPGGVVRFAGRDPGWDRIDEPINVYAQARAQSELPALAAVVHAADTARQHAQQAADDYSTAYARLQDAHGYGLAGYRIARHTDHGDREDPETIARLSERTTRARDRADTADRRVQRLTHDPALTARPDADTILATAHSRWEDAIGSATHPTVDATVSGRDRMSSHDYEPPDFGYGLDRAGPSIGM